MAFNSIDLPSYSPGVTTARLDQQSCKLFGATALIVQALMGIIVISSLLYKRQRESPKRPWAIWMFDVSKQVIGQMFVHGVNVFISALASHVEAGNACAYYFLNILIDTTLGVGLIYTILHLITLFFSQVVQLKGFESGQYGSPPSFTYWAKQTSVYVAALTTMKFVVIGLFFLWPGILKVGEWLMGLLGGDEHLEVIFTMGLFPIIMNVIQFWLIDSIVKASDGNWTKQQQQSRIAIPSSSSSTANLHEPLLHASRSSSSLSSGNDDDNEEWSEGSASASARARPDDAEAQRRRTRGSRKRSLSRVPAIIITPVESPTPTPTPTPPPPQSSSSSSSYTIRKRHTSDCDSESELEREGKCRTPESEFESESEPQYEREREPELEHRPESNLERDPPPPNDDNTITDTLNPDPGRTETQRLLTRSSPPALAYGSRDQQSRPVR